MSGAGPSQRVEEQSSRNGSRGDNGQPSPGSESRPPQTVILVDASNVAHGKTSVASIPTLENLRRVLDRLRLYPARVVALADASLRHKIDRRDELEGLFKSGELEQVPAGTSADDFLWQLWESYTAQGIRSYIVTNDQFPIEYAKAESRLENPRIAFLLVGGELMFQPPIEALLSNAQNTPPAVELPMPSVLTGQTEVGSPPTKPPVPTHFTPTSTPPASQRVGESRTEALTELVDGALGVIASLTEPPEGRFRRVNFATVSHELHQKFGGDFVERFGLGRPKDLAEELAKRGLVTISYTNTTMYVEPTLAFEGRIVGRRFARRQAEEPTPTEGEAKASAHGKAIVAEIPKSERPLPEVLEVSSRSPGPSVEVSTPEQFVKLVSETHPTHVFHWWSWRVVDEKRRREGEFFFVLDGTYYCLTGMGYRTLGDFIDGRKRGVKGAEDFKSPDRDGYGQRLGCWMEIVRLNGLDYATQRPSEADVYYYIRGNGVPDFEALKAAHSAKPDPPGTYRV